MHNYNLTLSVLALSEIKGIGPAFVKKYLSSFRDNEKAPFDLVSGILDEANKEVASDVIHECLGKAEHVLSSCTKNRIHFISIADDRYPELLREIKGPPPILYTKGPNLNFEKALGVIGTREPTPKAAIVAERIGNFYSERGWSICNGLAAGIDSDSIKSAKGNVVGVLAGGLDFDANKTLLKSTAIKAAQVLEAGATLVSPYPPTVKEDTYTVIESCKVQAGLSSAMVLIQSTLSGGSKFTLKTFSETERVLGIIDPSLFENDDQAYEANFEVIRNGKQGISKFVDLKPDKVKLRGISIIKSKADYLSFESLIGKQNNQVTHNQTLFD